MAKEFPTFWVIVLVLAGVWFLQEMEMFGTINLPWFPAIVFIASIGAIVNHYKK
ncbi:hypothetical protein GOV13_02190 [Candidatus Pacearchaeota archaeon]|nr:hypothetical protein [Candidatus Pacearchaeota archaeon]